MEDIERCYQILELEYGASPEEVGKAYRELSKVWHPDRFLKESPSVQQKVRERQREINQAYEQLQVYHSEQLPIRSPDEGQGMEVNAPDVRAVDKPPTPEERPATKVGRFVSYWIVPILRKAVSSLEPRQEGSETSSRGRPRNLEDASGRRQGRGQGRKKGRGQGRRRQNRGC
jgi:hypothetical protein